MNDQQKSALDRVTKHFWADAEYDWDESERPADHVFRDLKTLYEYLMDEAYLAKSKKHICDCGNEHEIDDDEL